jgi:hypothetical protein
MRLHIFYVQAHEIYLSTRGNHSTSSEPLQLRKTARARVWRRPDGQSLQSNHPKRKPAPSALETRADGIASASTYEKRRVQVLDPLGDPAVMLFRPVEKSDQRPRINDGGAHRDRNL